MPDFLFNLLSLLKFRFQAQSNHYLHSPFVFEWYNACISSTDSSIYELTKDYLLKQNYIDSSNQIKLVDLLEIKAIEDIIGLELPIIICSNLRKSAHTWKLWSYFLENSDSNYLIDTGNLGFIFKINNHSPQQVFKIKF